MNIDNKKIRQVKAAIKRLYKEYDKHMDKITLLDDLLGEENVKVQRCFGNIKKHNRSLKELDRRGMALLAPFRGR